MIKFRRFLNEDAPALIKCIREEYGSTYFRKNFYNEEKLINENQNGSVKFFIAEDDKELAGILAFEILSDENICELICGIISKNHRGRHISTPFFDFVVSEMKKNPVNSMCCYPVLYHSIVQNLLENLNFIACGFVFSEFLDENSSNYYKDYNNSKKHYGLMFHKINKNDSKIIYLSPELNEIASKIYSSLNVKYEIENKPEKLIGKSELIVTNNLGQQHCTIKILSSGEDLITQIKEIHSKYKSEYQTFNIFLNINESKSIIAYRELKKLGYFFTGFKPISGENENLILHNAMNVDINFNSFVLNEEFTNLKEYVQKCYERRKEK